MRGLTEERRERRREVPLARGYYSWLGPYDVLCFVLYRDACVPCCPNPAAWADCCCFARADCFDGWIVPYFLHKRSVYRCCGCERAADPPA